MRAAIITQPGGPEVLTVAEAPAPIPGAWEIRVRVEASALNRADLLQRRGNYPAPHGAPKQIPGLEYAGVVETTGANVRLWKPGDRVMGLVGGGANAELVVVHEREAMRVPEGLSSTEAAAVPEAFMTAWDAAVLQGGLRSGQWLAINAVGSGVGTAAIQIARALGARSVGSARTVEKIERAKALGLDHGGTDLIAVAREAAPNGASVLVDLVGGPDLAAALGVLQLGGSAVLVGLVGGVKAEIPLGLVLQKRLKLIGTVLRARPLEEKIALARAFEAQVVPLFEARRLAPVIERVFPLAEIEAAHRLLESNLTFGKVVLDHI